MFQSGFVNGDNGDRTRDLLTASQALSQLSYTPMYRKNFTDSPPIYTEGLLLVEIRGFEPLTS